jgi:hypothetical protein
MYNLAEHDLTTHSSKCVLNKQRRYYLLDNAARGRILKQNFC